MTDFNRVILMGRLTRDPQVRYLESGTAVGDIGMAINRRWYDTNNKPQDEVTFVDVTVWGKNAENLNQYQGRGGCVHVEGRLQLDQWTDAQTNQPRQKLKVVAERVKFVLRPPNQSTPQGPTVQQMDEARSTAPPSNDQAPPDENPSVMNQPPANVDEEAPF